MTIGRNIVRLGIAGAFALGAVSADATTIVDVPATATGTTLFLDAGTYSFDFIGTATGGAYDAWNAWNDVSGCNGAGSNCAHGWLETLALDLGNGANGFDRTNGSFYWQNTTHTENNFYSTAAAANAAAQPGAFLTTPLVGAGPAEDYTPSGDPFTVTLQSGQNVNFFIKDRYYDDNVGGVSISLSKVGAVPEPATWAMMLVGFGAVGAALRRRKTSTTVRFA